jgi:hypothetical protein
MEHTLITVQTEYKGYRIIITQEALVKYNMGHYKAAVLAMNDKGVNDLIYVSQSCGGCPNAILENAEGNQVIKWVLEDFDRWCEFSR